MHPRGDATGVERGGGRCCIVFCRRIDRQKKRETERDGAFALGGCCLVEQCNNQIIVLSLATSVVQANVGHEGRLLTFS